MAVAVVLAAAGAVPAGARALSPLEQGLKFYKGKTVTFIITGGLGTSEDLLSRALVSSIGAYLRANVVVESIGAAEGIPGSDDLAAAAPNGLTIGEFTASHILIGQMTNTPGYNFNPERLAWLGEDGPQTSMLIANPSSPWSSFAAVKRSPTPVTMLTLEPPAVSNADLRLFMATFSVHPHYLGSYVGNASLEQGYIRGDGPIAYGAIANLGPFLSSGVARPLAYTVLPAVGTNYRPYLLKAPSFAELVRQYPPRGPIARILPAVQDFLEQGGAGFFAQTGVAGYKVEALRAALSYAFHRPTFRTVALSEGLSPVLVPGPAAKAAYLAQAAKSSALSCYVLGTC